MNTRTRTFDYHVTRMGFANVLQGHNVSEKVYALIQSVENGYEKVSNLIATWTARSRTRSYLANMDYRMLRDIGMEPYDAMREANKPFWKA